MLLTINPRNHNLKRVQARAHGISGAALKPARAGSGRLLRRRIQGTTDYPVLTVTE